MIRISTSKTGRIINQKLTINAQLMPVRDLTIDLKLDKTFGKTYSELYKDTTAQDTADSLQGSIRIRKVVSVSAIFPSKPCFHKIEPNEVSETFLKFQEYRQIIAARLSTRESKIRGTTVSRWILPGIWQIFAGCVIASIYCCIHRQRSQLHFPGKEQQSRISGPILSREYCQT